MDADARQGGQRVSAAERGQRVAGGVVPPALSRRVLLYASIAAGAFAIVYFGSWWPSYWSDEVATVAAGRLSPAQLLEFTSHKDAVHAVYYLVVHAWGSLFGYGEAAVRGLSALSIACSAVGTAAIGSRLDRRSTGIAAAIILVLLPRSTYMGIEARSFALSTALVVASALALLMATRSRSLARWALFVAASVAAVYVFLYSILVLVPFALFVWFRRRDARLPFAIAAVAVVVASLPLALRVAAQKEQIAWIASQPSVNPWTVLVEPYFESSWLVAALVVVAAAALAVAARRHRLVERHARHEGVDLLLLAGTWAVIPVLLLLVADALAGPLYLARYVSFCVPGFALVVARLIVPRVPLRVGVALLCLLVVSTAPTYAAQRGPHGKNGGSDLRELARFVEENKATGDAVYFDKRGPVTLRPRLAELAYPEAFTGLDDITLRTPFERTGTFTDGVVPLEDVEADLRRAPRVWVATAIGATLDADSQRALRDAGLHVEETHGFTRTQWVLWVRGE